MKRKFGLIVIFPNCLLDDPEDNEEMLEYIRKYMDIDINKCYIRIKHEFETDVSLVRLTSSQPIKGLTEHSYYGYFLHEKFPIEKLKNNEEV